ncbi:MAG: hypothetical protein NHB15_10085 [Methanosarcina barkeri]|nr:hypothetical protein [Methanosarcina sp. ERenArc_MAG2]
MSLDILLNTFCDKLETDITGNSDLIGLLSIAIILISAIIYYFGVRWGETQVEEYNVTSHYFAGTLFVVNYILEPYVVVLLLSLLLKNYTSYFSTILIVGLTLEFILYFVFQYGAENFRDRRESLDNFVECKKINQRKWLKYRIMRIILSRLVPIVIIFIVYIFYKLDVPVGIILLSFILALLTFTNFAFCVGYYEAHYREANLYLKNREFINGIILKRGSYVNVLTEDGTRLINKDNISTIKMSKNSKELCCDCIIVNKKLTYFLREIW